MRPSTWSPEISSRRSGWCRHDVRRRVAGRLDTVPVAEVRVARRRRAAASRPTASGPLMPVPPAAPLRRPAPQRLLRHAALARHLDPPRQGRLAVVERRRQVLVARMQPELAAGPRRAPPRPARSGRRARACRRAAARPRARSPTCSSARSRSRSEPGSCMPQSTSTIPSPAASAQALQCGTPGHGQRQPQAPDAGQHALAAPIPPASVPPASAVRMAADANVRAHGRRRHAEVAETYFAALARARPRRDGGLLGAGRRRQPRRPGRGARPGGRPRRTSPSCSRRSPTSR